MNVLAPFASPRDSRDRRVVAELTVVPLGTASTEVERTELRSHGSIRLCNKPVGLVDLACLMGSSFSAGQVFTPSWTFSWTFP